MFSNAIDFYQHFIHCAAYEDFQARLIFTYMIIT